MGLEVQTTNGVKVEMEKVKKIIPEKGIIFAEEYFAANPKVTEMFWLSEVQDLKVMRKQA